MYYVIVCVRMSVRVLKNLVIVVLTRCEALSISESFSALSIVGGTSVYLISILTEYDFGAVTGTPTIYFHNPATYIGGTSFFKSSTMGCKTASMPYVERQFVFTIARSCIDDNLDLYLGGRFPNEK